MTTFFTSARIGRQTAPYSARCAASAVPTLARPTPSGVVRAALVVDDDPAMLDAAVAALAAFPDAEVRCATTLAEAEWLVRRRHFDLALVDLGLPDGAAVTLIRRLASPAPGMGAGPTLCVARAAFEDDAHLVAALAAGAHRVVLTGDAPSELRAQLLAAVRGESSGASAVARQLFDEPPAPAEPAGSTTGPLSPRETEVLRLVARGLTIAETAERLGVSGNTVKAHVKRTYAKLDVRTRAGAAHAAIRLGLMGEEAGAA